MLKLRPCHVAAMTIVNCAQKKCRAFADSFDDAKSRQLANSLGLASSGQINGRVGRAVPEVVLRK
jgi:hypothetical protein